MRDAGDDQHDKHTLFGLKLNFFIPSSNVVFFCFALSNLVGSSASSGVGPLVTSAPPGDNFSTEKSGVIVSRRDSSACGRVVGSIGCSGVAVPHATNDLRTATRHSRPCLRSCASELPIVDVSTFPGTDIAAVLNEGGTWCPCWCFV